MKDLFIYDQPEFKRKFRTKFLKTKQYCPEFAAFINAVTVNNTAYIVGGYLRDIQIEKESRDIDIIIDMSEMELDFAVNRLKMVECSKNRLGGYKLKFINLTVDFWSIETNWAFKNKLVKHSEKYILERIGKGCFYNFDSLVIDIKTFGLNVKFFNECISSNNLDILMSSPRYRNLNPTKEANILRAFYLKKEFGFNFSERLFIYLKKQLFSLQTSQHSITEILVKTLEKYDKYKVILNKSKIEDFIKNIKYNKSAFSSKWNTKKDI